MSETRNVATEQESTEKESSSDRNKIGLTVRTLTERCTISVT